ncbi:MAG: hypothetical protein EBX50_15805 [Chitinophagia bacterium]|nr:hypothetical protein [Chitinophagia bacterium]
MAKKNRKKTANSDPFLQKPATEIESNAPFNLSNWIPYLFIALYLLVEFIPNLGSYDTMGPQWFYLSLVDMLVMAYLLYTYHLHTDAVKAIFSSVYTYLLLLLLIWASISVLWAFNSTETWVCLVRLLITVIAFFNLFIICYAQRTMFISISYILSAILLLQSIQSLSFLFSQIGSANFNEIALGIKGNAGNKNIYAASIMIKIPFALFGMLYLSGYKRIFFFVSFLLGTMVIVILNSRTTYVSYLVVVSLLIIYEIIRVTRSKEYKNLIRPIGIIVPGIIAILFSQALISSTKYNVGEESTNVSNLGYAADRMSTIVSEKDDSRNQRLAFWKDALEYIKNHPLKGAGYGNWKLESIEPSKDIFDELSVPLHAHNDFLEFFAELGIPGGVIYISLFIFISFIAIKFLVNGDQSINEIILIISALGFIAYAIDAFFNFPIERPINQIFFALVPALGLSTLLHYNSLQSKQSKSETKPANNVLILAFCSLMLLLPAAFVTYQTYQSLIIQEKTRVDMDNEPVQLTPDYVATAFPSIPNIGFSTLPLDGIKARYLGEKGRYEEAMKFINRIQYTNPHLMYAEFLKALVYINSNQPDSAFKYAAQAFYKRPRVKNYYNLLIATCVNRKDTTEIKKAFYEFIAHRPDVPATWDLFLQGMTNVKISYFPSAMTPQMLERADSALKKFPNDTLLLKRKLTILKNL